jgi:hypothetical protein
MNDPRRPEPWFDRDPIEADSVEAWRERRLRRILSSIQRDVDEGGTARVRQITGGPRELYRVEVERPDMSYLRTTVMEADALALLLEETPEELLRERFIFRGPR